MLLFFCFKVMELQPFERDAPFDDEDFMGNEDTFGDFFGTTWLAEQSQFPKEAMHSL